MIMLLLGWQPAGDNILLAEETAYDTRVIECLSNYEIDMVDRTEVCARAVQPTPRDRFKSGTD